MSQPQTLRLLPFFSDPADPRVERTRQHKRLEIGRVFGSLDSEKFAQGFSGWVTGFSGKLGLKMSPSTASACADRATPPRPRRRSTPSAPGRATPG